MISRDDLENLLSEHRYLGADDVVSKECSCGKWPKAYKRNGDPTTGWLEHVLDAAFPLTTPV